MLNFEALFDQAKEMLSGQDLGALADVAELGDVQQMISDAGLDLGALAEMSPQDAADVVAEAGLDPELLSDPRLSGLLETFTGGQSE